MHLDQQKEQFSIAYVHAVATVAGFTVYKPGVDDDSVDLGIAASGANGSTRRPRIEVQLKCSEVFQPGDEHIAYPLKIKNYDDLRGDCIVPRLLIVLAVPTLAEWIRQDEAELALRRCAYYLSLRDSLETTNTTTVTVHVPRPNVFSTVALQALMQRAANGEPL